MAVSIANLVRKSQDVRHGGVGITVRIVVPLEDLDAERKDTGECGNPKEGCKGEEFGAEHLGVE